MNDVWGIFLRLTLWKFYIFSLVKHKKSKNKQMLLLY